MKLYSTPDARLPGLICFQTFMSYQKHRYKLSPINRMAPRMNLSAVIISHNGSATDIGGIGAAWDTDPQLKQRETILPRSSRLLSLHTERRPAGHATSSRGYT